MLSTISLSGQRVTRDHHRLGRLLLLLVVILSSGCATTADNLDRLNRTLLAYERSIRWAQFDAMYDFHRWENTPRPELPAYLQNIKVTGYDVEKRLFNEDKMTTDQTVSIRYYNTETSREKTLRMQQHWEYFKENNRWYLMSEPPVFQ